MANLIYAAILAFTITIVLGFFLIDWFRRLEFGQNIREVGPKRHLDKAGIPTMGGVMIILAVIIATLLFTEPKPQVILSLFVMVSYGVLGLLDDAIKVVANRSLGLRAWQKILSQGLIAVIVAVLAIREIGLSTEIMIPFLLTSIDLGRLFIPFVVIVLLGSSNAVNLTDGLDGLAAGVTVIVTITYAYIAFQLGQHQLAVFSTAIAGACLGFSWFNSHPAEVFMGDTGSLALGGALGGLAVFTKTELFLVIIGGVYVVEALSVILQVGYFKLTGGDRIFRMSPLHHHFELKGWEEAKVVTRFWILAVFLAMVGLLGLVNWG